ncbi:MAG: hypothetical protein V1808_00370 [Candidatus Daviesbacteria bacterium]
MKIYFTCSTAEFFKYKNDYFSIRDFLISQEHVLTRDWLPETEKMLKVGNNSFGDVKDLYKKCISALKEAEIVIIDDTVSNFSTGHQITLALQYKKPTLVLWQGRKHRHFKEMFIHGITSDLLEIAEYSKDNLKEIIEVFIAKYEKYSEKNRFHLVLNNMERMYLDWAQYVKGKSRTKVIKEALREVIDKDKEYLKYLRKSK